MKICIYFLISFFPLPLFCQTFSETDIKKLAVEVNRQIKGISFNNGIKAKGCLSLGRTLIYQYEVPENWEAPENIKEEIISNLKTAGDSKIYFLQNIDVYYYYYKGNSLAKKVGIKSIEFSIFNFQLGDYISIKDHPKAKGVNLKIKMPIGWEDKEGNLPNIVKKFEFQGNLYLITILDNINFFSRKEIGEMLQNQKFVKEYVQEGISFLKFPVVLEQSIVSIDSYPAIYFKVKGESDRTGFSKLEIMKCWVVFYEDKIVLFQSIGLDNPEFRALEQLYLQITYSVIFPDQYN